VGTATFVDPQASVKIIEGLERFLQQESYQSLKELVPVARS